MSIAVHQQRIARERQSHAFRRRIELEPAPSDARELSGLLQIRERVLELPRTGPLRAAQGRFPRELSELNRMHQLGVRDGPRCARAVNDQVGFGSRRRVGQIVRARDFEQRAFGRASREHQVHVRQLTRSPRQRDRPLVARDRPARRHLRQKADFGRVRLQAHSASAFATERAWSASACCVGLCVM